MSIEKRASEEVERLRRMLFDCNVPEERIDLMQDVIVNTAWMKVKLEDAREAIEGSTVAIPYDNGGGQSGIRENPLFKGYEGLFKTYMSGLKQILDVLPPYEVQVKAEEIEKPKTVLELVRSKKKEAV